MVRIGAAALLTGALLVGTTPAGAGVPTAASPAARSVDSVFGSMSDAQRVGQLFMASLEAGASAGTVNTLIAKDHVGNVILQGHWNGRSAVRAATASLRAQATSAHTAGVGMWLAGDQEGGYIQPYKGSGFDDIPSAVVQGTHSTGWQRSATHGWASQLHAAGLNIDLAPVGDVVPAGTAARNAPIGALRRNFGSTSQGVSAHVQAFIDGMRAGGVSSVVKHFPGLGRVTGNTDVVSKVVDRSTQATTSYLAPYAAGIADRSMVMVSLAYYEKIDRTQQAAFSSKVITGVLRGQLHYHGVVLSDSLAAASAATSPPGSRAVRFLSAGGDVMVQTDDSVITAMETSVLHQMAVSTSFRNRVYDSVKRVLAYKRAAGLLP